MADSPYVLGHSEREIRRLINQAAILRATTERLLRSAGVARGMRVLDLGCGAGDVTLLTAEIVGPSGWVIGVDRNPDVLEIAGERARRAGLQQIGFTRAAVRDLEDADPFDVVVVVGRYVLIHQADPVAFLRQAARLTRPGGTLAFHEIVFDRPMPCQPQVALWTQTTDVLLAACRANFAGWDAGGRLIELFLDAGLPLPDLFCETPIGGGADTPLYTWVVETIRSVLPHIVQGGLSTAETLAIDSLERRLRDAVVEARSQIEGPAQLCAWTTVPMSFSLRRL